MINIFDKPERRGKKLLLIAYYFPPLGGSGALRPLKIAKYISYYGWDPIIITVKNPDWYYAHDPGLLKELDSNVAILKTFAIKSSWIYRVLNPLRIKKLDEVIRVYFLLPDVHIGWLPHTYFSVLKAVKKYNPQIIYSTSGPLTCHLVAYLLKKKTGLPWIAEFRDEWIEDPKLVIPTPLHKLIHYKAEKLIVENADKIISMAPVFNELLSKHLNTQSKFETIQAGFDPDDIIPNNSPKLTNKNTNTFRLVFTGLFYDTFRPKPLIKAITDLIAEGKIPKKGVTVNFVGANSKRELNGVDKFGICEFTGFLPRKEAIKIASKSDALLLLLSKERGKDVIPSKTFEYLSSGKPILALVPKNGEVAKLIKKTNAGLVVEFDDIENIKSSFLILYNEWKHNCINKYTPDKKVIEKYSQKKLIGKLAGIFNEVVNT